MVLEIENVVLWFLIGNERHVFKMHVNFIILAFETAPATPYIVCSFHNLITCGLGDRECGRCGCFWSLIVKETEMNKPV